MTAAGTTDLQQTPSDRTLLDASARIRMAIVAVLLLGVYWGTIRHILIARWMNDANWSHGWLIPIFSLYFLNSRREQLLRTEAKSSYFGAAILALSLFAFFVFSWRVPMAYPRALSLVGTIFGLTLLLTGWRVMRIAWFPILFLLLAIPLPDRIYVDLTMPLRQLASTVAASVMPLFADGLHTEAQSVVIDYIIPGMAPGTLNVDEACSGMRSTMAFIALGVASAYLGMRPPWQRAVMVASCIPIALFCNTIRVTITGLLFVHGHPDLARGTPHTILGLLMFTVAMGLFSLLGYVLTHLFVEDANTVTVDGSPSNSLDRLNS